MQPNDALLSLKELSTAACCGSANASSSLSLDNYMHLRQTLHGKSLNDLERSATLSMHNNSGHGIAGFTGLHYSVLVREREIFIVVAQPWMTYLSE